MAVSNEKDLTSIIFDFLPASGIHDLSLSFRLQSAIFDNDIHF